MTPTLLVVSDGDAVGLSGGLFRDGDAQNTVGINMKGYRNLKETMGTRRNAR